MKKNVPPGVSARRYLTGRSLYHAWRCWASCVSPTYGCYEAWRTGRISFAEFDASVQGWINHVRYADSWHLREQMLRPLVWGPAAYA